MGLEVIPFRHGPFWNFSYLIACEETREAAIIDPAWDVAAMLGVASARQLRVRTVLLTHSHSDHANGVAAVVGATGAEVCVHSAEAGDLSPLYSGPIRAFESDETWRLGQVQVSMLHTPGHSLGSVSFLADGRLFAGDTLHVGGAGTPGYETDALEALWQSLAGKLLRLPAETLVHPGHDAGPKPSAMLGDVVRDVPALRAATLAEFTRELERSSGRRFGGHSGPSEPQA